MNIGKDEQEKIRELEKLKSEAIRLMGKIDEAIRDFNSGKSDCYRSSANAAVKRSSMDMSRALSRYRNGVEI